MAARTIRDERERNAKAMLEPFMPCGAKLPEYKLPSVGRAVKSKVSCGWSYVVKAGTVILLRNGKKAKSPCMAGGRR